MLRVGSIGNITTPISHLGLLTYGATSPWSHSGVSLMRIVLCALLMERCGIIGYEEQIHMKVGYLVQPLDHGLSGLAAYPIAKSYG